MSVSPCGVKLRRVRSGISRCRQEPLPFLSQGTYASLPPADRPRYIPSPAPPRYQTVCLGDGSDPRGENQVVRLLSHLKTGFGHARASCSTPAESCSGDVAKSSPTRLRDSRHSTRSNRRRCSSQQARCRADGSPTNTNRSNGPSTALPRGLPKMLHETPPPAGDNINCPACGFNMWVRRGG
jgi:hypothetical protein